MDNPTSERLLRELWLLESGVWHSFCEQIIVPGPLFVIGHLCTDVGCSAIATSLCYWPGQTRAKCMKHRDAWARVAATMGFILTFTPLDVRDPDPTAARFAAMELY